MNTKDKLNKKINNKGYYEQEKAMLFSGLYNRNHVVTKNTIGAYKEFDNKLKKGKLER